MKIDVLKRLSDSLDQHYGHSYSKEQFAVLMGEDDFRDLRAEVKEFMLCFTDKTDDISLMGAKVHSDLRVGNRGWIIGSKTEIKRMRKHLMEAQARESWTPCFWDWTERPKHIDFWAMSEPKWSLRRDYEFPSRIDIKANKPITIKLHVVSVTEHGAGGGHDATLYHAMPTDGSYAVNLDINSASKLIELGYYEMTLRKVE